MEATVPLSEFEKQELEKIGNDLGKNDPRLAVLLSQDFFVILCRTRIRRGLIAVLVGVCVLAVGLISKTPLLGIAGFAVMSAAGYWTTRDVRWMFVRAGKGASGLERNND
jgi:hypothetical protein